MSEGLDSRIEALEAEMKWRRSVLGKLSAKVTAAFFGGIAAAFIQVFLPMVYVQDQVVAHRLMAVDENHNPVVVLRSFADANGKGTLMNTLGWLPGDYPDDLPFSALELHV